MSSFIILHQKEDHILKKKAAKSKVSVCEYIRRTAVNGKILRYDILSLHDDLIGFRMVCNELNAIAKKINTHRKISENDISALNTQLDFLESYTEKFSIPTPEIVGKDESP